MSINRTPDGVPNPVTHPDDGYDDYYAYLGGGLTWHVVDPRTFDNSTPIRNEDGSEYDGYTANVGRAETLCGLTQVGRLLPIETDVLETTMCGNCLRVLGTKESEQ